MNLKIRFFYLLLMLFSISFYGQNSYSVKGTVTSGSDGMPLPGVSVVIMNSSKGVDTDFDGNFMLDVSNGDVLQFSYLGFKNQVVTINGQQTLQIVMEEDSNVLDEVVVVGYGTQKKSHLTGSISKVTNEDLEQIAVSRVDDALVGQVSGVNIQATDSEAGAAPTITIRGVGSMAGDSTPLIVVDGVIVDSDFLGSLNMNDVESFEVLKDAASASVFGSKGSNGVIMITMKSGVEGKVRINYAGYTGLKTGRKSEAYGTTLSDWAEKQMDEVGYLSNYTKIQQAIGTDRAWQDVLIDGGIINSHSFSARGGNDKTKYVASVNYSNDEGVLLVDNFRKFGARAKLDFTINDKFSAGINFSPTYTIRRRFSESIHNVARHMPWLPIYHDEHTLQFVPNEEGEDGFDQNFIDTYGIVEEGDYARMYHFELSDLDGDGVYIDESSSNIGSSSNQNPYAKVVERDRSDKKFKLFSSIYGKYKIAKGLNFKTSFSASFQDTQRKDYLGTEASRNGASAAYINEITDKDQYYIIDNFFNFDREFGNHEIGVTLGNSIERRDYFYTSATAIGIVNDFVQQLSNASTPSEAIGLEWTKRGISYISRFNYAYDDKYLASLSLRRDGSSIFGSEFKYGNFPAASIGWNVDREEFLSGSDVISKLKLRASYGVTGNDRLNTGSVDPDSNTSTSSLSTGNVLVDYYPSLDLVSSVSYIADGVVQTGYTAANIGNSELKWERLIEINPGIDFGLFRNKISGSIDWYQRTSDQLLLNNPISVTSGFSNYLDNIGEVKNQGWEFELRTKNINSEKFKWGSTFLVTTNKNTLIDFADSNGQITSIDPKRPAEWINLEGQPISSFYGYVVERELTPEELNTTTFYRHVNQKSGVAFVKDLNGDGVLDDEDKTILGNPYPELIWSFGNDFVLGNVDVSFMFQGSHGAEVRNITDEYMFNYNVQRTPTDDVDSEFVVQKIFTDDIIQDASYIALRNVNIGYNVPDYFIDKLGLSKFRVYASGQNLLYFTADDYTGWNPEALNKTSPTQYGYQRGGSPIATTVSLGVNIDF